MDSFAELQRRKTELKAQIEQQQGDLKRTFVEIRQEIEPATLLKKAVIGVLGFSKKKPTDATTNPSSQLPGPLGFLVDLFIKDPKWILVLKVLAPMAMKYLPALGKPKKPETKELPENTQGKNPGVKIFGPLRRGISTLRSHLRKTEKTPVLPEN